MIAKGAKKSQILDLSETKIESEPCSDFDFCKICNHIAFDFCIFVMNIAFDFVKSCISSVKLIRN